MFLICDRSLQEHSLSLYVPHMAFPNRPYFHHLIQFSLLLRSKHSKILRFLCVLTPLFYHPIINFIRFLKFSPLRRSIPPLNIILGMYLWQYRAVRQLPPQTRCLSLFYSLWNGHCGRLIISLHNLLIGISNYLITILTTIHL